MLAVEKGGASILRSQMTAYIGHDLQNHGKTTVFWALGGGKTSANQRP